MPVDVTFMNFGPIVTALSECVCAALTEAERPVCRCCPGIGPSPWTDCSCKCDDGTGSGQLAITVGQVGPSRTFPNILTADQQFDRGCGPPLLMAALNVELARCLPWGDMAGTPPTCEEQTASVLGWYTDLTIIRQAAGCCLASLRNAKLINRFSMGFTTPIAESGGCVGQVTQIFVALGHCVCP